MCSRHPLFWNGLLGERSLICVGSTNLRCGFWECFINNHRFQLFPGGRRKLAPGHLAHMILHHGYQNIRMLNSLTKWCWFFFKYIIDEGPPRHFKSSLDYLECWIEHKCNVITILYCMGITRKQIKHAVYGWIFLYSICSCLNSWM